MQNQSPDNSIIIYSEHKKRVYETPPNEISQADNDQVNQPIPIRSDSYDSEDNKPLSQLTTQGTTDQHNTTADKNDLVYTPQLGRKRVPALHTRLLRARSKGQGRPDLSAGNTNSEPEVVLPKPNKKSKDLAETLKKIETSITNLTIQGEQTQSQITQINENMAKITTDIVSREELTNAISNVTDAYLKDKKTLEETLVGYRVNLDILGEEIKEGTVDYKAKTSNLELLINETKLTHLLHQEKMTEKITQLEAEVQTLKNKQPNRDEIQPEKSLPAKTKPEQDTRKNIIIEGLNENPHEDIYQSVIETIKQTGLNIFENDIDLAYRIGSFKGLNSWPRPVRVTLVSERVKLHIMENRDKLQESFTHYNVRFVKDEPKEKRVSRAKLRKGAQRARERGCKVINKNDAVEIDGKTYNLDNAHEIDNTYKDALLTPPQRNVAQKNRVEKRNAKLPCEREADTWLAFYTEESTYSSFHKVPVTYRNVPYKTLEHGYQAMHALKCNDMEAYNDVLKAPTAAEAKLVGSRIPFDEHWETVNGPHMEELQYAKYMQHPHLRKKLCSTVGKTLIEASKDRYWGAGVLINSPSLETKRFGGQNELGKRIGNARTRILTEQLKKKTNAQNQEIDMETSSSLPDALVTADIPVPTLTPADHTAKSAKTTGTVTTTKTTLSLPANTAVHSESIEILELNISPPPDRRKLQPPLSPKIYYKEGVIEV